jgi:hypothetical protein
MVPYIDVKVYDMREGRRKTTVNEMAMMNHIK